MTIEAKLDSLIELQSKVIELLSGGYNTPAGSASPAAQQEAPKKRSGRGAAAATAETPPASDDDFLSETPATPAFTVDKAAVRAALVEYQGIAGADKARALMKEKGGADTLGAIPEGKYTDMYNAAKKATAEAKK